MTPILQDAFRHHTWATRTLLDACAGLTEDQLATPVRGLYGGVLETFRHIVGADSWYLFRITGGKAPLEDEDTLNLAELRALAEQHTAAWDEVAGRELDPDASVVARRDDGGERHARLGIRLAQALHHGTDHRSQICTALTTMGIEPPGIDVWAYGEEVGRVNDTQPDR